MKGYWRSVAWTFVVLAPLKGLHYSLQDGNWLAFLLSVGLSLLVLLALRGKTRPKSSPASENVLATPEGPSGTRCEHEGANSRSAAQILTQVTQYQELATVWADIDNNNVRALLSGEMLKMVDELSSSMLPVVTQRIPVIAKVGMKQAQGYLGALIITGYALGRVYLGTTERGQLLESILPGARNLAVSQILKKYSEANPLETLKKASPSFQLLFGNTLDAWMEEKGLAGISDSATLRDYLELMMLNGWAWALCEDEVIIGRGEKD